MNNLSIFSTFDLSFYLSEKSFGSFMYDISANNDNSGMILKLMFICILRTTITMNH